MKRTYIAFALVLLFVLGLSADAGIFDWFKKDPPPAELAGPDEKPAPPSKPQPIVVRTRVGTNDVVMAVIDSDKNVHIAPEFTANQVIVRLSDIVLTNQQDARAAITLMQQRDRAAIQKIGEILQMFRPPPQPRRAPLAVRVPDLEKEIEKEIESAKGK